MTFKVRASAVLATQSFLLLMSCLGVAQAAVCSGNSLQSVLAESDVIVVGRIAWVGQRVHDGVADLMLAPIEVVRGPVPPGAVRIEYPSEYSGGPIELADQQVLVFLKRAEDIGVLRPVPLVNCSPMRNYPPYDFVIYPPGVDGAFLPDLDDDSEIGRLIGALATVARHQPERVWPAHAGRYLLQLAGQPLTTQTLPLAFDALMATNESASFNLGLSGHVTIGDFVGLQVLDEAIAAGHQLEREDLFRTLRSRFLDTDPRASALLGEWLQPHVPTDQRIAAARALVRVQTANSTVVLSQALYDAELEVRWAAVEGLIPFANFGRTGRESPEPGWPFATLQTHLNSVSTPSLYVDEEETYLEFWKTWWEENQDTVQFLAAQEVSGQP